MPSKTKRVPAMLAPTSIRPIGGADDSCEPVAALGGEI